MSNSPDDPPSEPASMGPSTAAPVETADGTLPGPPVEHDPQSTVSPNVEPREHRRRRRRRRPPREAVPEQMAETGESPAVASSPAGDPPQSDATLRPVPAESEARPRRRRRRRRPPPAAAIEIVASDGENPVDQNSSTSELPQSAAAPGAVPLGGTLHLPARRRRRRPLRPAAPARPPGESSATAGDVPAAEAAAGEPRPADDRPRRHRRHRAPGSGNGLAGREDQSAPGLRTGPSREPRSRGAGDRRPQQAELAATRCASAGGSDRGRSGTSGSRRPARPRRSRPGSGRAAGWPAGAGSRRTAATG